MEKDIYEMYLNGPFDWLNPLDMMTELFTGGPKGAWARKPMLKEYMKYLNNIRI